MRLVTILLCASILFFANEASFCINSLPKVLISNYSVDEVKKELIITYSVFDPDEGSVRIKPEMYDASGNRIEIGDEAISGDVGYPVACDGSMKSIVVDYGDLNLSERKIFIRIVADDLYKTEVAEIVDQVNPDSVRNYLSSIYGPRNYEKKNIQKYEFTRDFILEHFRNDNLVAHNQDTIIEEYSLQRMITEDLHWNTPPVPKRNLLLNIQNLIGEKQGVAANDEVIILGAHYDTKRKSPGADDNGSGVAGVLEAARILSKYNFKKNIRFICFDREEDGYYGSWFYVEKGLKATEKLVVYLNFDMIGHYSEAPNSQQIPPQLKTVFPEAYESLVSDNQRGNFMLITANENSSALSEQLARISRLYVPKLKTISLVTKGEHALTESLTSSDHAPFWYKQHKAIYVGEGGESRNKYKDTKRDVIERVNYEFITSIVKATVAMVVEAAGLQHTSSAIREISIK